MPMVDAELEVDVDSVNVRVKKIFPPGYATI